MDSIKDRSVGKTSEAMNRATDKHSVRVALPSARCHHGVAAVRFRKSSPIRRDSATTVTTTMKNLGDNQFVTHTKEVRRHPLTVVVRPKPPAQANRFHLTDTIDRLSALLSCVQTNGTRGSDDKDYC
jgi:hypothetical protein